MQSLDIETVNALIEYTNSLSNIIPKPKEKPWYEYATAILPTIPALFAVYMAHRSFNLSHIQSAKSKVVEKDIDRLYKAADLFFEYADALGLFLSMTEKKAHLLLSCKTRAEINELTSVGHSLHDKTLAASDAVFSKFRAIHMSEFLLKSLAFNDVASEIIKYREETIAFRKDVLQIANFSGSEIPETLTDELTIRIKQYRVDFLKKRDHCLLLIANHKSHLQQ